MNEVEAFSLGITIGLGLLSVGLSIFAIWLSHRFASDSNAALDQVKGLAGETRTLVDASLSQQKDFSSRMLDSILEQNKFGASDVGAGNAQAEAVREIVYSALEEFESRVSFMVENEITKSVPLGSGSAKNVEGTLASIRSELARLSEAAPRTTSGLRLPAKLRTALEEFRDHPAHYVAIAAIVRSGAATKGDLESVVPEYQLPMGWEGGVETLIAKGVLEVAEDGSFYVPEEFAGALESWVGLNWHLIRRLIMHYKIEGIEEQRGVSEQERQLGQLIIIG